MKFKTPKAELLLAYMTLPCGPDLPPSRTYVLFEESHFVLKDAYHVESGRLTHVGLRRVDASRILGRVKGIHKVDRRTAQGARCHEYHLLEDAFYERHRIDGAETNFSWFEERVAVFDEHGIMHTVLELDQVVASSRVA